MKFWGMNGRSESFTRWPWGAHDREHERGSDSYDELWEIPEGYSESWSDSWLEGRGTHYPGDRFGSNDRYGGHYRSYHSTQRDPLLPGHHPSNNHVSQRGGQQPIHHGSRDYGSHHPSDSQSTAWGSYQGSHPSKYPGSRNSVRGPAHSVRGDNESEPIVGIVEEPYEPSAQSGRQGGQRMIEWPGSPLAKSSHHSVKSSRHPVRSSHHSATPSHHSGIGSSAPTQTSSHGSRRMSGFQ